jgi:hypothetical protein
MGGGGNGAAPVLNLARRGRGEGGVALDATQRVERGWGWHVVVIRTARSRQPWPDSGGRACVSDVVGTGRRRLTGGP